MSALPSTQPTKFSDIPVGSTVRVVDTTHGMEPYEGVVDEYLAEVGRTRIPALKVTSGSKQRLVTAVGRWRVEILVDGSIAAPPVRGVKRVELRPQPATAIQWDGTLESAVEVIKWAPGKIFYDAGSDTVAPHLWFYTDEAQTTQGPGYEGEWFIRHQEAGEMGELLTERFLALDAEQFEEFYRPRA